MRIIRIVVILLAAAAVVFPFSASADETTNTDTNINSTLLYFSNLIAPSVVLADEGVAVPAGKIEKVKSPEEIQNEAILTNWKEKQASKWEILPKESFTINASAYTASADECGNSKGITSSGIKHRPLS